MRSSRSRHYSVLAASGSRMPRGQASYGAAAGQDARPELADIGRLARMLTKRAVTAVRAQEGSVQQLLAEHLGADAATRAVATGSWPAYDHVNIQAALDAWLAEPGRQHQLVGLTNFRHFDFGLADLMQEGGHPMGPAIGSVATEARPAGPGGITRPCVRCGIYLTTDPEGSVALLMRGPDEHGPMEGVTVQVAGSYQDRAQRVVEEIRRLSLERNVFRGHVLSFGDEVFGHSGGALLSFLDRPPVGRDQVVLPAELLDGIERQVVGVARHASRLLASGQHLKRGVLLYGAPGTGKTHTVRYLLGRLPGVTAVVLSGGALGMIAEACSVARALQPSLVVVEDVDLIAEERGMHTGQHPLLFQLLNEMDGLGHDIDVTFVLTTNRADLLEEALAARPGRVDHAALLPVPDAPARRRLVRLYQGGLDLDLSDPDVVISRTEGVTASFIKELLRRAALHAAEQGDQGEEPGDAPLRVTDADMNAALGELLDTRNALTRVLLGGGAPQEGDTGVSRPARPRPAPWRGRAGS